MCVRCVLRHFNRTASKCHLENPTRSHPERRSAAGPALSNAPPLGGEGGWLARCCVRISTCSGHWAYLPLLLINIALYAGAGYFPQNNSWPGLRVPREGVGLPDGQGAIGFLDKKKEGISPAFVPRSTAVPMALRWSPLSTGRAQTRWRAPPRSSGCGGQLIICMISRVPCTVLKAGACCW